MRLAVLRSGGKGNRFGFWHVDRLMFSARSSFVALALLSGCARPTAVAPVSVPQPVPEQTSPVTVATAEPEVAAEPPDEAAEGMEVAAEITTRRPPPQEPWTSYNVTYQVTAKNLPVAVAEISRALVGLGAEVTSSSSSDSYGQVYATFPSSVRTKIRDALAGLDLTFTSENVSRTDLSSTVHQTGERLQRLEFAREEILDAIRRTRNPARSDALALLLEMTENERSNLERQLTSYRTQAELNNINVTVTPRTPRP
jgi:hypothetical protein